MKELCVRCGKETEYDINTPVTVRRYFIEGSGQLCEECFKLLYCPTSQYKRVEKSNKKIDNADNPKVQ